MRLVIDNSTGFLNDYYFQTLCLLYFPGEKFPAVPPADAPEARIAFIGTPGDFCCTVRLCVDGKTADGVFSSSGYDFAVLLSQEDEAQITAGRAFLDAGEKLFGFRPPWGCITGLRPAKRARHFRALGNTEDRVRRLFSDDYLVSPGKTELTMRTAARENALLAGVTADCCGLYVSIPFCPTRCAYCSFVSYSNKKLFALIPDYLEKLLADIRDTAELIASLGLRLSAIYIGGGTPSILDNAQTERLFAVLGACAERFDVSEFTYESGRPDTTTGEKLAVAKRCGVNRVSINPQSTSDAVLARIGRRHTAADFFRAVETAHRVGFGCLNADLIAGLPGDTQESFDRSLSDVLESGFENITVHTLSIKNASPIRFSDESVYDAEGIFARACVDYAYKRLCGEGYAPYYFYRQKNTVGNAENTGYSIIGAEGIYNILMMEEYASVFACGAGAITKLVSPDKQVIERLAHPKYPFEYLGPNCGLRTDEVRKFYGRYF